MSQPEHLPLQRLLNRQETRQLLAQFEALMPGARLALLQHSGTVFIGAPEWSALALTDLMREAMLSGQILCEQDVTLYPLSVSNVPVGGLAVHGQANSDLVGCLRQSLTLLMAHAAEKRELARETLERYREINVLYKVAETISAGLNQDDIPDLTLAVASQIVQSDVSAVLLQAVGSPDGAFTLRAFEGDAPLTDTLVSASQPVIEQARARERPDIAAGDLFASTPIDSVLCAPLRARSGIIGVVLLGRLAGQPIFTAGDEKLVMALADQAAISIEKAWLHQQELQRQRLEEELAVARRIQLGLLPKACPIIPGWEFAAAYQAAKQVGGDLYDCYELPDGTDQLGIVIADVTGKGIPAALFMAFCRAIIRTESMTGNAPAVVLERANTIIGRENSSGLLLSALYLKLDLASGRIVYANGGHDYPLWMQADTGVCHILDAPGVVLGAFGNIQLQEHAVRILPGDVLVLYTDGITEARNLDGGFFGEERLQAVLQATHNASAEAIVRAILDAIHAFVGAVPLSDDLTLFVIKRQPDES